MALVWASGSIAQQTPTKIPRVGILSPADRPDTAIFDGFRKGLRELGYIDGQNISVEFRLAAGDTSRLPAMAAELVRLPVDVIVTDTQRSAIAAHEATSAIPIVMGTVADPLAAGLIDSFAHPGGNVTGFTLLAVELGAKRLELLKEAFPAISRFAVLWNPAQPPSYRDAAEEAARILSVRLRTIEVATPEQIPPGFEAAAADGAEALVVLGDAMFWNRRGRIVALAAKYRMPAAYDAREYAVDGSLLTYGASVPENFRRAAGYVDKILKGAHPADLPVQQPATFQLVVNLKTAEALGLTIPPSILARADEVID